MVITLGISMKTFITTMLFRCTRLLCDTFPFLHRRYFIPIKSLCMSVVMGRDGICEIFARQKGEYQYCSQLAVNTRNGKGKPYCRITNWNFSLNSENTKS